MTESGLALLNSVLSGSNNPKPRKGKRKFVRYGESPLDVIKTDADVETGMEGSKRSYSSSANSVENKMRLMDLVFSFQKEITNISRALSLGYQIQMRPPSTFEEVFIMSGVPVNPSKMLVVKMTESQSMDLTDTSSRGGTAAEVLEEGEISSLCQVF